MVRLAAVSFDSLSLASFLHSTRCVRVCFVGLVIGFDALRSGLIRRPPFRWGRPFAVGLYLRLLGSTSVVADVLLRWRWVLGWSVRWKD
jgi:hypothetical protein